jgi:hypothetical protein
MSWRGRVIEVERAPREVSIHELRLRRFLG